MVVKYIVYAYFCEYPAVAFLAEINHLTNGKDVDIVVVWPYNVILRRIWAGRAQHAEHPQRSTGGVSYSGKHDL